MVRFIVGRIWQVIITLFVLATMLFILTRLIGDPVDMMLPSDASPSEREYLVHKLGLDQPYYVQYTTYMVSLLRGDVGDSLKYNAPVAELFFERFPNTIRLAVVSIVIAMVLGFTLGMASATRRGTLIDQIARAISVIGMSAPHFWLGLIFILVFAVQLRLLPVARMEGPQSYILPALTWSFFLLAGTARLVRSSMIEALSSEYVKLARIKGVSETVVLWKHCLRNVLIPVTTFAGVQLAFMLNGSVAIESVFAWPGVGRLVYQGIQGRDYPLVQGSLLIIGFLIIMISLFVDILYAYIDPRIRIVGGKQ
jgi:ABC-type dipeptide/oligopeptide/nickel transport system permease component